jgi:hypothetical protein
MTTILTDANDRNKYYDGDPQIVPLPDDVTATAALSFLDAVEWSAVDNKIRVATGADDSKYVGAVLNGGGVAAAAKPTLARNFVHQMTIAAATAAISQGDRVKANTGSTCEKVSPNVGLYTYPRNTYGIAMEAGVAGASIKVFVEPKNDQ